MIFGDLHKIISLVALLTLYGFFFTNFLKSNKMFVQKVYLIEYAVVDINIHRYTDCVNFNKCSYR